MSSALDMSLDDLIKNNKKSGGGGGGGGGVGGGRGGRGGRGRGRDSSGPGPARRFSSNRGGNRATPYSMGKPLQASESAWQHDLFTDHGAAAFAAQGGGVGGGRASAIETGTKLYISNLEYGVSNEDIKELFSEVGDIKRYSIHYDRSGRSKGTAEVVFSRRSDAAAAVKRYNNVQLDGKPMKIEIVGTNIATPAVIPPTNGLLGNPNVPPRSVQGPRGGGAAARPRGGGAGGRGSGSGSGRGRGRGRGRGEPVSAVDLDADLEKYHSEAMQIN